MLALRSWPERDAVIVVGCVHAGRVDALLLESWSSADPAMTLRTARAPRPPGASGPERYLASAAAFWELDRPRMPVDPLAPPMTTGGIDAGEPDWEEERLALTTHTGLRLAAAAGELLEVEAGVFGSHTNALAELLDAHGRNPALTLAESGFQLAEGRRAHAACPGDMTMAGLAWYAAGGEAGRLRRQAAHAMPLFAGILAAEPEARAAVDARRSLTALLRGRYPGLGAGGVRRLGRIAGGTSEQQALGEGFTAAEDADILGNVRQRRLPLSGSWKTEEALGWLDRAAAQTGGIGILPQDADSWRAFTTVWSGMIMPMATHFGIDMLRMRPEKGDWRKLLAGLGRDLDLPEPPDRRQLNIAVVDAAELADLLAADIVLPAAMRAIRSGGHRLRTVSANDPEIILQARQAALDMLIPPKSGQPLRACAAAVRTGLTRLTALEDVRRAKPENSAVPATGSAWLREAWEPPWPDWTAPNGARFRFLPDRRAMQAEGETMQHCIGRMHSYWLRCWRGAAIAAHIKPPTESWNGNPALESGWRKGATVFMKLSDDDSRTEMAELHGFRNLRVSLSGNPFRAAADQLAEAVSQGGIERRPERGAFRAWLRTDAGMELTGGRAEILQEDPWQRRCGHDFMDPAHAQRLWEEWRPAVPGSSGTMKPEAAVWRQPAAQRLLAMLSPDAHERMASAGRRACAAPKPKMAL